MPAPPVSACRRRPAGSPHSLRFRGFLWLQKGFGLNAVFIAMAVIVAIAAIAVTQVGPEPRGLALDEVAPPTA